MNGSLENEKLVNLGREIRVGNELRFGWVMSWAPLREPEL